MARFQRIGGGEGDAHLCQRLVVAAAIVQGVASHSNFAGRSLRMACSVLDPMDLNAVRQTIRSATPDAVFYVAGQLTGSQALCDASGASSAGHQGIFHSLHTPSSVAH
jgi:hypothetical protein